jgi:hypothetical protein
MIVPELRLEIFLFYPCYEIYYTLENYSSHALNILKGLEKHSALRLYFISNEKNNFSERTLEKLAKFSLIEKNDHVYYNTLKKIEDLIIIGRYTIKYGSLKKFVRVIRENDEFYLVFIKYAALLNKIEIVKYLIEHYEIEDFCDIVLNLLKHNSIL